MTIARVKARWTIPGAGTAYTILHYSDFAGEEPTTAEATGITADVRTFFNALGMILPNVVSVQVSGEVEILNEESGTMIGVVQAAVPGNVVGSAGAAIGWAAAAGAVVTWNTAGVRNGRRVRGRSFVVPLANSAFDTTGTLSLSAYQIINDAATALRADGGGTGNLMVWARPTAPGAVDGIAYQALGHRVPDMSAILRSRRS